MTDPILKSLLQQADTPLDLPAPSTLITAILHRRQKQRTRRRTTLLTATALIITLSALTLPHHHPTPPIAQAPVPHSTRVSIEDLTRQAAAFTALANRLEASERLARATQSAAWSQTAITLEQERAAATLLAQGDWQRAHHQPGSEQNYLRATQLFPDTHSASQARTRLTNSIKKDQA
jgi:hypothetical protein